MNLKQQLNIGTDRRGDTRLTVERGGTVRNAEDRPLEITIRDVSLSGCLLTSTIALPENTVLNIGLPGCGRREGRIVWREAGRHGVEFLWPLTPHDLKQVRSSDNLILGAFPQTLDMLLTPDVAADAPRVISRRNIALFASAAAATWLGVGMLVARVIA